MTGVLAESLLLPLSESLARQTGLHFPRERWSDLERGITAAAKESGYEGAADYSRQLLSSEWTAAQIAVLAGHLTTGETYFFRHQESFAILERYILTELIAARRESRRYIRVWCAGCSTGEEPYSIAIMLRKLLPDWKNWDLTILGTDINPGVLVKARQGIYREWSFRGTGPDFRRQYFTSPKNGCFEILPEIRDMVQFAYLNVAGDGYPSASSGTSAVDVILCRNVLMYFAAARAKEVARGLQRSLAPRGWLLVSPAEFSQVLFADFESVQFPGAFLYRKKTDAAVAQGCQPGADRKGSPENVPRIEAPSDARMMACMAANHGDLGMALIWCDKAIAADKLNPRSHYLRGAILQESGLLDEAAASLKRALYLYQDFTLAHFSLGNLCRRQGLHTEAARHFNNALRTLCGCPPAYLLPDSEGMTAERMTQIIRSIAA